MNKLLLGERSRMTSGVTAHGGAVRGWQRWTPYAAVVWSTDLCRARAVLGSKRAWIPFQSRT